MPPPFRSCSLDDFAGLLERFPFTRRIESVHMHHTWRPNHGQYRGHESIVGMWRHHTEINGWSDIAQHTTIAPDGVIWLGRSWNWPPASARGFNGNSVAGPFMFETIGDFDVGRDRLEGAQRDVVLKVIALVQRRFGLPPEAVRLHNEMSGKSCPGSSINKSQVLEEVRQRHDSLSRDGGWIEVNRAASPFGEEALAIYDLIQALGPHRPLPDEPWDAEPPEAEMAAEALRVLDETARGGGQGRDQVTPAMLTELRPHVVNLSQGQFSSEGVFATSRDDVDAIFDEHLVRALEAARGRDRPLHFLFYAHGGLVSESRALRMAFDQLHWWQGNAVYPLFFVWETGLFETIGQLLRSARSRMPRLATRDVWDFTTDPLLEEAARALQGERIWAGMKRGAERAVDPSAGGAHHVAQRLKDFWSQHRDAVSLHAVGHSAGAIFHAHFLPVAMANSELSFRTVHFLAPALRADSFHRRLADRMGNGIDALTIFTMRKELERADNCFSIYRKSLLYLIHHALEPERAAPLLGLEESLRADSHLRRLFGLDGKRSDAGGNVIWSISPQVTGQSASTATTHGGFDNDAPTMESVLRRILGKSDSDRIVPFPSDLVGRGAADWLDAVDWPESLEDWSLPLSPVPTIASGGAVSPGPALVASTLRGRRLALCVGINNYTVSPLSGCVPDARAWAETFRHLGFEPPRLLLDSEATRSGILDALAELIRSSAPGDVVAFQFSGHGTQLPDDGDDEAGGDTPDQDEALCPFDFTSGAFVIDDDIAEIFTQIPDGVNVTCFIDCCHSGTVSRFGVGTAALRGARGADQRPRFLVATPAMIDAHRRFRRGRGIKVRAIRGPETMREVLFSACRSDELAWESGGQGDFTMRATQLLRTGIAGVTNAQFVQQLTAAFGPSPRQHPELDCAPAAAAQTLLQPLSTQPAGRSTGASVAAAGAPSLAQALRSVANALETGSLGPA